jgi:DNA-binding PadR family transcriptional regulator
MSLDDTIDHIGTSSPVNPTAASVLGYLTRSPMTGWEVYAAFETSIGYFWNVTRSQVYRELRTLASGGLIVIGETGARDRRVCSITPRGRAVFAAWITAVPNDELIRFPLLLATFFGELVPTEVLRAAFREHRRRHAARLTEYESRIAAVHERPFPFATLRFGMAYEQTVLDWIDSLPWMADHAQAAGDNPTHTRGA